MAAVTDDLDLRDVGPGEVAYEVLCRGHHREGTTRHVADRLPERSSASR